ncbi:TraE/TraK family type IV conjugative transfer system protein [Cronobacter sakazakii]
MNAEQKALSEKKQTRVFLILVLVLSALTYKKVDDLESNQKLVIVPYGAKSSDLLITGESASSGYMRSIARLIITDYGSVSRTNVDEKFSEILSIVYPDRVEAVRRKLNERAKYFKQFNSVSQVMELMNDQPMTITENHAGINYKTDAKNKYRFEMSMEQRKIIGDKANPPETIKGYIDYTIAEGRIWILDIQG